MTYEYRCEEVDATKTMEYEKDKKAQREKQEEWIRKQKNATEPAPQAQVTAK